MRFLYPSRLEKFILKEIGDRWRQHKSDLKSLYFDASKSMQANNTNVPKGVIKDQWITLVSNWMSQKAQDISEKNKQNCTMRKSKHTAGTKSFPRVREEMRQKDPEKKNPHRAVLYIHTHKRKSEKNMNEKVVELKRIISNNLALVDTSTGKTSWKGDVLNTILGEDKAGHVHGLGLVPNPNQVLDVSSSRHFKDIHLTSLEDKSNEDILSVRLRMEKLEQRVKSQDALILELQGKKKQSEGQVNLRNFVFLLYFLIHVLIFRFTLQCSLGEMSKSQDALCIGMTNSKRKRVYSDTYSQQLGTIGLQNNVMSKEKFHYDMEMQPSNKCPSKDKNKETLINNENVQQVKENASVDKEGEIDLRANNMPQRLRDSSAHMHGGQNINKISKGANATKHANKQQGNAKSHLGADSIDVGTIVFLKSLGNPNRNVALATLQSVDPEYKIEGVQLGNEFWAVRVDATFANSDQLIRPLKKVKIIGHSAALIIAWPSTFITKIN